MFYIAWLISSLAVQVMFADLFDEVGKLRKDVGEEPKARNL